VTLRSIFSCCRRELEVVQALRNHNYSFGFGPGLPVGLVRCSPFPTVWPLTRWGMARGSLRVFKSLAHPSTRTRAWRSSLPSRPQTLPSRPQMATRSVVLIRRCLLPYLSAAWRKPTSVGSRSTVGWWFGLAPATLEFWCVCLCVGGWVHVCVGVYGIFRHQGSFFQ
jgi:hypothetical protein